MTNLFNREQENVRAVLPPKAEKMGKARQFSRAQFAATCLLADLMAADFKVPLAARIVRRVRAAHKAKPEVVQAREPSCLRFRRTQRRGKQRYSQHPASHAPSHAAFRLKGPCRAPAALAPRRAFCGPLRARFPGSVRSPASSPGHRRDTSFATVFRGWLHQKEKSGQVAHFVGFRTSLSLANSNVC